MKAGILTLQGATNYGAVLQCLGLYITLKNMGHEPEVIDYYTPEVYGYYDYRILSRPITARSVAGKALRRFRNEREYKAFESFRRSSLSFSSRCTTSDAFREIATAYDAVIVGSDQVWNPRANGGLLDVYYLGLLDGAQVKKVSYAASFGSIATVDGLEAKIACYLDDYAGISVREEEATRYLSKVVGRQVERVIDPSMLVSSSAYAPYEKAVDVPEGFILSYMLNSNDTMTAAVERARRTSGLTVIALGRQMRGARFIKDIGPGEFLYLFRHASSVLTNSFHGTAFSLLYNKPFLTFGSGAYNSRMETLLSIAGQEGRFIADGAEGDFYALLEKSPVPDFESVVEAERNRARLFLSASLGEC